MELTSDFLLKQDNPIPLAVFLFLLAPQLVANLRTNGAFEIYLDDAMIYSKLESGNMPTIDDLVKPLVAAGLQHESNL
jgi:selT/selW/selH-like putative selenoprotein